MSLNDTPTSNRRHIGIFGKCNAGKSSVINAITGQELAIVSEYKGTTTDPVYKTMELLPLGPVVIIDTPGLDDEGALADQRIRKAHQVLNKTDIAVLVVDASQGMSAEDDAIVERIKSKNIPYVIAFNKMDLADKAAADLTAASANSLAISCREGRNIQELKELIARQAIEEENNARIIADLLQPNDLVVLVTPIDKAAPKGRLILPQQQTIRDILEVGAAALIVQDTEFKTMLGRLAEKPRMVVTDSQVFAKVAADTPADIPLTSFSILFARYKGDLEANVRGARELSLLQEGDKVLISEGCTHHRQCNDIGTVKLPNWIRQFTGKNMTYQYTSGTEFPDDLTPFRLIIHCGACMLNEREVKYRMKCAHDQGIPMTNYGVAIAYMHGILKRTLQPFPNLRALL
ncbi:MAG: [FeFe] hydrogenase H-cluster maturation GTPase HydF [Lentisphaerae bacterium]|jgi:[FeFe] hydrogenase H-cluster maturation GTPase HydF|nr:[FeFe] hydrogenase H-cluster maturation GTPase HydF [Lentisphaerota bacterium]